MAEQKSECVCRKALERIRPYLKHREDVAEVCYDWCPLCAVEVSLSSPCPRESLREPVLRCGECGGTMVYQCTEEGYRTLHSCTPRRVREGFAELESERDRLRAELAEALEAWQREKEERIRYQDIVYTVCNFLDIGLGNSPTHGTGILAEKVAVHVALTRLFHNVRCETNAREGECERLRVELAEAVEALADCVNLLSPENADLCRDAAAIVAKHRRVG